MPVATTAKVAVSPTTLVRLDGGIVICGEMTGTGERLNTDPSPALPPRSDVPYKVLPDKSKPARGVPPVNDWKALNPVPFVLS